MTMRSPMHQQIDTLPELIRQIAHPFDESARYTFNFEMCTSAKRIYLVGCGDSHHAAVGAELAFHQLAGIPAQALTSNAFSRYTAAYLPPTGPNTNLMIGISVSGAVSRTIEAVRLAGLAGAVTVALTGNPSAPIAGAASRIFKTTVPPLPDELNMVVPGVRSYLASQVGLYSAAIRIGEVRGHLTTADADALRAELSGLADILERTIAYCEPLVDDRVRQWSDATDYVFVGGGPLYGAALFSAAKLLEASGDPALGQDTEEWAHLQYFVETTKTPTVLLSADGFDADRMAEVARACRAIGRRTVAVVPEGETAVSHYADVTLPVLGRVRECFAPIVYSAAGELIAAARAQQVGATYFRGFGGGRKVDWSDGASNIRGSHMLTALPN
jgi:glucosamine--fructose-6-phosphate aminotransferase (isomerizing)